ncbi:MAG TPA: hypothetical protein DCX07_01935, partial [Phycisphaerales bacterium]|nr:hypothetical protein [Phycisphaerales bacterium]
MQNAPADNASPAPAPRAGAWALLAVILPATVAAVIACNYVWDCDVFWHLAAGDWMLHNRAVLGHDPFTADPEALQAHWVNVHWLFQVAVAAVHTVGGFVGLTLLKSALAVAAMLAFVLPLRRRVPPAWLTICALAMLLGISSRLRVRPEAVTLVLIPLTIHLVESVRLGGSARRLWWMVPVMLLWANLHGLFILGLGLLWGGFAGAAIDRLLGRRALTGGLLTGEALVPAVGATLVCLLTPWPIETVLHPLLLLTRISGQAYYYSYGVSELQPTFQALGAFPEAIVLTAAVALVLAMNLQRVPAAHFLYVAAFVLLAMSALRNVALAAPVLAWLLAVHGGELAARAVRAAPRLRFARIPLNVAAVLLAAAAVPAVATGWWYRALRSERMFGAGLETYRFPVAMARFLASLPDEGDILCANFGDASTFVSLTYPARKVWMDGRLEVHSEKRFIEQHKINQALGDADSAGRVPLPDCARFLFVSHKSENHLAALSANPQRFRLFYVDPAGACFARLDWPGPRASRPLPAANLDEYDRPLDAEGYVADTPRVLWTWWRQTPRSLNLQLGRLLLAMGKTGGRAPGAPDPLRERLTLLATRYLAAAAREFPSDAVVAGTLGSALVEQSVLADVPTTPAIPADPYSARALRIYGQFDLSDLRSEDLQVFALRRVWAMGRARQIDAADRAVREFLDHLPPREQVNPPRDYLEVRNVITQALEHSRRQADVLAGHWQGGV